jgi:hypothetical protein
VADDTPNLPDPELEFVFEIRVDTAEEIPVRTAPGNELGFIPITGGVVSGPRFTGSVVPNSGGDWAAHVGDTWHLDARYALQHDDGSVVEIWNTGYYRATAEQEARIAAGEAVPEAEYYYRCAPRFSTDASQHLWLPAHQFVGLIRNDAGQICIRVFLVR